MSAMPAPPPAFAPPTQGGAQNVTYVVYQMPMQSVADNTTIKIDWSNCFTFYVARAALMVFLWASWVVYIAGVAQNNLNCNNGLMPKAPFPSAIALSQHDPPLSPTSAGDCVRYFALEWWSVWLQFTTTLAVTATTLSLFAKYRYVKGIFTLTLYFIIMSSILMFLIADIYNSATYWNLHKVAFPENQWTISCSLTLVGTICCLILNFIYLIWNSYNNITDTVHAPSSAAVNSVDAHVEHVGDKAKAAAS